MTSTRSDKRALELLAPARDLECGIAAVDHGADAVYIGADNFGARAAAGNSVGDIRELCAYAHVFGVRVYVTVNTIIYDNETAETERLITRLYDAGVDAILVQDMGVLRMDIPPIELHASTQTDNRTAAKAAWLARNGFSRVVLARELSVDEIRGIHEAVPTVELEAFVHGALCVSYSGVCYASQCCFRRSANRGECAQFCRLKFNLEDADGRTLVKGRHLLSLKDMCRIDCLERLADAGVTSFKIEGRLKDAAYVKNVTAAYRLKLDEIIARRSGEYRRASFGRSAYTFTPQLAKTFNRGFTPYFADGRRGDIASMATPKATGEHVGHVKEVRNGWFTVAGTAAFANGDGLCFINNAGDLCGFRVNRADGNKIFPLKMPAGLGRGTELYRNLDYAFTKALEHRSAERKIGVNIALEETAGGFRLTLTAENGASASAETTCEKQEALKPQKENAARQLCKLGGTPFESRGDIEFRPTEFNFFIPSSVLADMRRKAVESLADELRSRLPQRHEQRPTPINAAITDALRYPEGFGYMHNVANRLARKFYADGGQDNIPRAYELQRVDGAMLMQCRHCIKYSLGMCAKHGGHTAGWREPLYLRMDDGRRFRLKFDCRNCQMEVFDEQHN